MYTDNSKKKYLFIPSIDFKRFINTFIFYIV